MAKTFYSRTLRGAKLVSLYGLLVPYTGYALYISAKSNMEITRRQQMYGAIDCEDGLLAENTHEKYKPLKIFGRYENPFEEYRIQTVYEFFFNRVVELFETNRGGIPKTSSRMDELMPIHNPTWVSSGEVQQDKISSIEIVSDTKQPLANNHYITDSKRNKESTESETPHQNNEESSSLDVTWLGQSCTYTIYQNKFKVLLDPLFSDFLINETFGPKRITRIPCEIENVPTPDVIIVSHNHPDHLDEKSLQWFNRKTVDPAKDHPLWVIPKGMGKYLQSFDIENYTELSWWETLKITTENGAEYHIHCTPAMHWSGRNLVDTNESLWCTYLVRDAKHKTTQTTTATTSNAKTTKSPGKNLFFHGGDTGYVSDLFTMIRNKYGSCHLGILPCGQYCPEWHQRPRHINPQEVIKIMKDLQCENVLGVHWGTFLLSGEYFREPKEKLETLVEWEGIDKQKCYCPELGKTINYRI